MGVLNMKEKYNINPGNTDLISLKLREKEVGIWDTVKVHYDCDDNQFQISENIVRNGLSFEAIITISGEEAKKLKQFIEDLVK